VLAFLRVEGIFTRTIHCTWELTQHSQPKRVVHRERILGEDVNSKVNKNGTEKRRHQVTRSSGEKEGDKVSARNARADFARSLKSV